MKKTSLIIFENIGEMLTLAGSAAKHGRHIQEADLTIIKNAALVVENGRISWVGPRKKLPRSFARGGGKHVDLKGLTVVPGFVECHTHTVFAGNRAAEFEMRNNGVSYQEIAAKGGGILSTLQETRAASSGSLLASTKEKVQRFVNQGVTTLEVKSGYALNLKDELKILRALKKIQRPRIISTFLGAHAIPKEFNSESAYLKYLSDVVLPQVCKQGLAKRVDIFIEKGFFTQHFARDYLRKAQDLGLAVLIHADQLSLCGGADLAVEMAAISADHLIQITSSEIQKLAKSEVTCVLLPAADLYMKCSSPPARKLCDAGARVSLATDYNPGSSPTQDLSLVGLLARLEMKMTLPEVISAYTVAAAYALGVQSEVGSLEPGKFADFFVTKNDWRTLFYAVGERMASEVYLGGLLISSGAN